MWTKVAFLCFVACVSAQVNPPPAPYSFSYEHTDEKTGAKVTQSENGDASNVKTGSYGINDPTGLYRLVQYIADAQGFRVTVDTNEPGTKSHEAANALYNSKAANLPAVAAAAPFRPAVLRPAIVKRAPLRPVSAVSNLRATPVRAIPITFNTLRAVPVTRAVSAHQASLNPVHFTLGNVKIY
ncbi:uncharacterized protein LOC144123508 [Amblyomma americanum]